MPPQRPPWPRRDTSRLQMHTDEVLHFFSILYIHVTLRKKGTKKISNDAKELHTMSLAQAGEVDVHFQELIECGRWIDCFSVLYVRLEHSPTVFCRKRDPEQILRMWKCNKREQIALLKIEHIFSVYSNATCSQCSHARQVECHINASIST